MSGPDSIRGFNFQHARAIHAALDMLDDPTLSVLEVEGDDDVIDFQVLDTSGARRYVAQVKSRTAPPWWKPSEIKDVIKRWGKLDNASSAEFQFISDGAPGPDVAQRLLPALDRLQRDVMQPDDHAYLKAQALTAHLGVLKRTQISLQEPPIGAMLDSAGLRVLRLLSGRRPTTPDEAATIVDTLFREISVMGGEGERLVRRLERERIAELIGVALDDLDNRVAWDEEMAESVRLAVLAAPRPDALVQLGLDPIATDVQALRLVGVGPGSTSETPPLTLAQLLDEQAGAALTGASGRGKSTALGELARVGAERQLVPITANADEYQAGTLFRLLWQGLEDETGVSMSAGAVESWLGSGDALVLVDGISERPAAEIRTVMADLRILRRDWPHVRLIISARDPAPVRALGLPVYLLAELDAEQREAIATQLLGQANGPLAARRLEKTLSDAAGNPLLLRMALSLIAGGVEPSSVYEIYDGFLSGLDARAGGVASDATLAALSLSSLDLVRDDRFAADRHWWRAQLRANLDKLAQAGLFDTGGIAADDSLVELTELGVLRTSAGGGEVRLLHDSFRDFLAARAIVHGLGELPRPLDLRFERVATHLAEAATPSRELLQALCDNPIAASVACSFDPRPDGDLAVLANELLNQLLSTHELPEAVEPGQLSLRLWASEEHLYVAVLQETSDPQCVADVAQFAKGIDAAVLVLTLAPNAGPLRIAVMCWQELLRAGLDILARRATPMPIPLEPEGLAAATLQHFTSARDELAAAAHATCRPLAARIIAEVGWRGIDGAISPHGQPDPWTGDTMHSFQYTTDTDELVVRVGEFEGAEHDWSRTLAEFYLHEPPREVAVERLENALKALLPTWGPG